MDRHQAEALHDSGKEPTVERLIELDQQNKLLPVGGLGDDAWLFPFSHDQWQQTPQGVQTYMLTILEQLKQALSTIEQLEAKLNQRSDNSHRPPSSDDPFKKQKNKQNKERKCGAKKGHQGHRQIILEPTKTLHCKPVQCSCGNTEFPQTSPYYTHQEIELPQINLDVTHFILYEGPCPCCGKLNKAKIPKGHETGYGPRFGGIICEMSGNQGNSRSTVQQFCSSVLNIHISRGAIQKVIDRGSEAIKPIYEAIARTARNVLINHIDETSWFMNGGLMWLWVMVNSHVAFFMVHANRSAAAFSALIEDWKGILISDGYKVYQKWVNLRQTCLAHLIRDARGLSQRNNPEIAAFGRKALAELKRLCNMANAPPTVGQWTAFYARLSRLISQNHERDDDAGKFARRLLREMDSLWVFLEVEGVEPTNNRGERTIRFGVLWRKRSQGTASEKGNRWVERILSLRQTCAIRSMPTFPILVNAIECYLKDEEPDVSWIEQQENQNP